jgi:hypothetical protein
MNDPEYILNPVSNRYVKKTTQCGKRLAKAFITPPIATPIHLSQPSQQAQFLPQNLAGVATPIQKQISETCSDLVKAQPQAFQGLGPQELDALFKKLLLEKLGVYEKSEEPKKKEKKKEKKKKFKVISSSSDSDSDSDSD